MDIVPREERDDAAMVPRVPQPMNGPMPSEILPWACNVAVVYLSRAMDDPPGIGLLPQQIATECCVCRPD